MKRAVALALVLIMGAAVVLWYGNTLNSWVLGGLIGGLAAILISIPISLTLFTFLSHRQEERVQAEQETQTELELRRIAHEERLLRAYERAESRSAYLTQEGRPLLHGDHYPSTEVEASWVEDEAEWYLPDQPAVHQLPPPQTLPQTLRRNSTTRHLPSPRPPSSAATRRLTRELNDATRQPAVTRRLTRALDDTSHSLPTTRRLGYPGFPGYQSQETLSHLRSQALHQAREEAAYQDEFSYQEDDFRDREQQAPIRRRSRRRVIDTSLSPISPVSHRDDDSKNSGQKSSSPETEVLAHQLFASNIQKPLVRRAPYLYDDDELKDELAQHVERPITRRSSRMLTTPQEDD